MADITAFRFTLDVLIALVPSAAIVFKLNYEDPSTFANVTVSGFFALCATYILGIVHAIPIFGEMTLIMIFCSVLINELVRFQMLRLFDRYFNLSKPGKNQEVYKAKKLAVLSFGYGFLQSLLIYGNALMNFDTNYGTYSDDNNCSLISKDKMLAVLFTVNILFHMGTIDLAYDGFIGKDTTSLALLFGFHILYSCLSLLNLLENMCFITLIAALAVVCGIFFFKFKKYGRWI